MQASGLMPTRFHAWVLRSGMTLAGVEGLTNTAVARSFSGCKASVRDKPGKIGFFEQGRNRLAPGQSCAAAAGAAEELVAAVTGCFWSYRSMMSLVIRSSVLASTTGVCGLEISRIRE